MLHERLALGAAIQLQVAPDSHLRGHECKVLCWDNLVCVYVLHGAAHQQLDIMFDLCTQHCRALMPGVMHAHRG